MVITRLVLISSVALTPTLFGLLPTPTTADPAGAAATCRGLPVTVVASTTVTTGTEGDDVVAMTPLGWSSFDALGGDDTICLALGAARGGRDPMPPTGWVDAGAGDDVVVDESAAHLGAAMNVGLGSGDDSFTGNDTAEYVYADSHHTSPDAPPPAGSQRDLIDTGGGSDAVWTTAPPGGVNADRVSFGGGSARVVYRGAMGAGGTLDVTASTSASLEMPFPGAAEPVARGELVVDNGARRATVGDISVLAWTGEILSFQLGQHTGSQARLPVSFTGTDAAEHLTVADGPVGDVRMAGGDDTLDVDAWNHPFVPRSSDGGRGHDTASVDTTCATLAISVARSMSCDGATGPFVDFEGVGGTSSRPGSRVTVAGTPAGEWLVANGDEVTLRGRGGADQLLVDEGLTTRVFGGGGADRIGASGDDVVVRGQGGRDRITLLGPIGYVPFGGEPPATRRQVALGGPGPDVLRGTTQGRADRLVGNRGRDRADGRAGKRDFCVAEVNRHCERP